MGSIQITPPAPSTERTAGWWGRRALILIVILLQVSAAVNAYGRPYKVFGWQMFNASSDWQAEVFRVDADDSRHDVRDDWPGGYEWGDLVGGRGFEAPQARRHADAGLDTTLALFQKALDWVAANTPEDRSTVRLEAVVTFWDNGRPPQQTLLVTPDRPEASP